jgi:ribosomal protein L6P/L9E
MNNTKIKIFNSDFIKNLNKTTYNGEIQLTTNGKDYLYSRHLRGQKLYNKSMWTYTFAKSLDIPLYSQLKDASKTIHYSFFKEYGKLHMIGLGYKNFVMDNKLYILIGDCNYIILNIPQSVKIFCKKNQIYALSSDKKCLFDFLSFIKNIKKINFYKGKGVLEFKNFKFTKLKVGKKQRFA